MDGNRRTGSPRSLWWVLAPGLGLVGLLYCVLAAGPPPAGARTEEPRALFHRAVEAFGREEYRAARDLTADLESAPDGVAPRHFEWLRAAAALRQARFADDRDHEGVTAARQALERLVDDRPIDRWGARAYEELVRYGGASDAARHTGDVLSWWRHRTDVDDALPGYVDLAEAFLASNGRHAHRATLLSMWNDVVRADPPLDVLESLGPRLLGDAPGPRTYRPVRWVGDMQLEERVARDLLARAEDPWIVAHAALVAGEVAARRGDFEAAVTFFGRAVDAVDVADGAASREAARRLDDIRGPRVGVSGRALYRPGSPHRLDLDWRNLRSWSVEIRRIDPDEHLRDVTTLERGAGLVEWVVDDAGELVWSAREDDAKEIAARDEDGPAGARHQPRATQRWIDPLPAGVYVVTARGEVFEGSDAPEPARAAFVVSGAGVLERALRDVDDGARRELWVVDMESGRPLDGVDLTVARGVATYRSGRPRPLEWTTAEHTTGRDGRVTLPVGTERTTALLVHGTADGQPVVFAGFPNGWPATDPGPAATGFAWTDRPLYRPGETLHAQAFLRSFDPRTRDFDVPAGTPVDVEVRDPRGEIVLERTVASDDNGSIDLAWNVPAGAALGRYALTVKSTSTAARASFEVGEVRLPEFTVDVALDRERRFVLGDTLEVAITASYLFGGPVRGEVEVTVRREPVFDVWPFGRRLPWLAESASPVSSRIVGPGFEPGVVVQNERVFLDEDGRAVLRIPTDDRDPGTHDARFVVEATVTDASRRQESGRGTVTVGRTELDARLQAERSVVAPGDRAWFVLRVEDAMDRGVAHAGRVRVERLDDDGVTPVGDERTLRTGDDGTLRFDVTFERTGSYRLVYESVDGRGFDLRAEAAVWVADPRTRDIVSRDDAIQLVVESPEVTGDTARVLLISDTPGRTVLLTRTHALGSTVEVVELDGTSTLLEIPLEAVHRPQFWIQATSVSDFRVHQARVQVVAPEASRLLEVDLAFDDDAVRPGTRAPLRVAVTDGHGDPVQTILSLAVVDEALLAIAPRGALEPLRAFSPPRTADASVARSMGRALGGYAWLDPEAEEAPDRPGVPKGRGSRGGSGVQMDSASDAFSAEATMVARAMPADAGAEAFTPANVRTDFRTTALWRTGVRTGADGRATIEVPLAESLTAWNAVGLAVDPSTRVGTGEATIRTRKPVMVRLQHPRVFRGADAFTVAALVHNETDAAIDAVVQFEAGSLTDAPRTRSVRVEAHGIARAEFDLEIPFERATPRLVRDDHGRIVGVEPESVDVQVAVRSDAGEDALRRAVDVHPFGSGLHVATTRELGPGRATLDFDPIEDRLPGSETVTLTVAPSMLSSAIDALPALARFPYGCVEQTLSRFVPAVAVRAVARRLDVATDRFDPRLDEKVADGLAQIAEQQNAAGGWGWWGGRDRPTHPYVTAYVLRALSEAADAGAAIDRGVLRRGREALREEIVQLESRPDDLAYALDALVRAGRVLDGRVAPDEALQRWATMLLDARGERTAYARALTASVLQAFGREDDARLVLAHLENDVRTNDRVDTAHWGRTGGYHWRGHGAVETTAFVLQAMVAIDPDHPRREAVARWLVLQRRGQQWDSTRSSAHALFALCDHLDGRDELDPDYTLVARQDGEELVRVRVDDVIDGGGRYELPAAVLDGGSIELELEGRGRAWVTFEGDAFGRARTVEPSGNGIFVRRDVVRLAPTPTLGAGVVDVETVLADGDAIASGDRLRIRLHLTLDHDLDFLQIEDPRVAGAEPTEQRSGGFTSHGVRGHREIRDDRTAFFVDALREGEHVIEYEVVAESPGVFHVAPVQARAMYLPDVAGHSARDVVRITADDDAR